MVATYAQSGDFGARKCGKKRVLSMITIMALVAILVTAAMATIRMQHASADAYPPGAIYGAEHGDEFGSPPLQPFAPEIEHVWAARIMVEDVTATTGTRSGYLSGTDNQDQIVNLTSPQFTYGGEDYTVLALYYQQTPRGEHKLVLQTDRPLPTGLFLHVGSDQYFGCEYVVLGSEGPANVWTIARDLGWADGVASYAALFEPRVRQEQPIAECLAAAAKPGSQE